MLERLRFDWLLFQIFGLQPDQAESVAWYLAAAIMVFTLLACVVWLRSLDEWWGVGAGCAAVVGAVLAVDAMMLRPVTAWLLMGAHRPDFLWVLHTYTRERVVLVIGFPLWHMFVFHVWRGEISAWLAPFRL